MRHLQTKIGHLHTKCHKDRYIGSLFRVDEPVRVPRGAHLYKGLATFHIRCSRNCQWDESRSLGVGVQALASNPLQAAAVGNVAVVSVAERYVLLS